MDDPAATSATVAHGHRGATTTCRGGSGRAHGDTDDGSEMDNDNCESESEEEMVKEVMGVGDSIIHDSLGGGIVVSLGHGTLHGENYVLMEYTSTIDKAKKRKWVHISTVERQVCHFRGSSMF